jgi:hypothetical protein
VSKQGKSNFCEIKLYVDSAAYRLQKKKDSKEKLFIRRVPTRRAPIAIKAKRAACGDIEPD